MNLGTGAVTDSGSRTVTLNGTGTTLTLGGAVTNTVAGTTGITTTVNGAGDTLALGSFVLGNANTAAITDTFNGSGNVSILGGVSNGAGTAGSGLAYTGTGALLLAGNSTYTGTTALSSGTLDVNSAGALGTGALTITGGTIDNTSGAAVTSQTNNPPITIGGNFAYGTSAGTTANNLNLGTGAVTDGTSGRVITLNGLGALTLGGVVTNTAGANNTLTVNNGTGTGTTSALNLGGLAISNSATSYTDTINGSGNVNVNGPITNGGTSTLGVLTYSGTGVLTLSGANTYSSTTNVNSGTLKLDFTAAGAPTSNIIKSGNVLTLAGGTFNVKGSAASGFIQTLGTLTLGASSNNGIVLTPGATGTDAVLFSSLTANGGSALNVNYAAGTTNGATIGNDYIQFTTAPTVTNGIISANDTVTDSGGTGFATLNAAKQVIRLADNGTSGLPVSGGFRPPATTSSTRPTAPRTPIRPAALVEALSGNVAANTVMVNTTGLTTGANLALGTNTLSITNGGGFDFIGPNPYTITSGTGGGLKSASAGGPDSQQQQHRRRHCQRADPEQRRQFGHARWLRHDNLLRREHLHRCHQHQRRQPPVGRGEYADQQRREHCHHKRSLRSDFQPRHRHVQRGQPEHRQYGQPDRDSDRHGRNRGQPPGGHRRHHLAVPGRQHHRRRRLVPDGGGRRHIQRQCLFRQQPQL